MNINQIYIKFPTKEDCIKYIEKVKWNNVPICPYCKSKNKTILKKENRYHCNNCNTSYSVTVGTIFHKSKIDLQKWFLAITLVLNSYDIVSSRQLSNYLNINKNTGWYMLMRIKKAIVKDSELIKKLALKEFL